MLHATQGRFSEFRNFVNCMWNVRTVWIFLFVTDGLNQRWRELGQQVSVQMVQNIYYIITIQIFNIIHSC